MLKHCNEFAKGFYECQKHAGIHYVPASELHSIVKLLPFGGWVVELIGEIWPTSSKGHKYILFGIDYFTKWVEVVPLINVNQKTIINFIQNYIICKFWIPETLTTDKGTCFTGWKLIEFALDLGIKVLKYTPCYAQANGQVKAAKKIE